MKNILVIAFQPLVKLTLQEPLGPVNHDYHVVDSLEKLESTLKALSKESAKPDLVMLAGSLTEARVTEMIEATKEFHDVLVIMDMDSGESDPPGKFGEFTTYPRNNNPNSPFFVRCREILGEQ